MGRVEFFSKFNKRGGLNKRGGWNFFSNLINGDGRVLFISNKQVKSCSVYSA